jgi:Uri superfamily endonuclease
MGTELTGQQIDGLFGRIDLVTAAINDVQEDAIKLRGHIDYLTEQVAAQAAHIEDLEADLGAALEAEDA